MFLQELRHHDNIVKLLDVIPADNDTDLYVVFEYLGKELDDDTMYVSSHYTWLETDLNAAIKAKVLQPIHLQFIMYQILNCLLYLHSGNVIHRDLKVFKIITNYFCYLSINYYSF